MLLQKRGSQKKKKWGQELTRIFSEKDEAGSFGEIFEEGSGATMGKPREFVVLSQKPDTSSRVQRKGEEKGRRVYHNTSE